METTFAGPRYPSWTSKRATRFLPDGTMLYPGERSRQDRTAAPYVYAFTPSGTVLDSVFLPVHDNAPRGSAFYLTSARGGRMLSGLNQVPFAPPHVWDITPEGTIISGDGLSYALYESDFDGTVHDTIRRAIPPRRERDRERRDAELDVHHAVLAQLERTLLPRTVAERRCMYQKCAWLRGGEGEASVDRRGGQRNRVLVQRE